MTIERTDPVNWSTLKAIGISPKHYLHGLATPRADTEAMQLGRLVHCAVLEPESLASRYVVEPNFHKGMNDETAIGKGYAGGKQAAALWRASVPDTAEVVATDIYERAMGMRDGLLADPVARPLVTGGRVEHKIEWLDPLSAIMCRGRFDHLNGCLSDLKSTRSLLTCERDSARLGYHAQLAWYSDGLEACGVVPEAPPCIVFVESVPPYDVLVLTFTEDDLAIGRRVYRNCLTRLAECRSTGEWPGVSGGKSRRIVLPVWAGPVEEEITIDGQPLTVS